MDNEIGINQIYAIIQKKKMKKTKEKDKLVEKI